METEKQPDDEGIERPTSNDVGDQTHTKADAPEAEADADEPEGEDK